MRDKKIAAVFAFFLGALGIHRFYLGQVGYGIFYAILALTGISVILGIIDALVFLGMSDDEFDGRYNRKFTRTRRGDRYYTETADTDERRYERARRENNPPGHKHDRSRTTVRRNEQTRPPGTTTTTAAAVNPNFAALKRSGFKKFKDFDYKGAIADLEEALRYNDKDIAIHFNLACAHSLMEQPQKSFYHIHRAVQLGFTDYNRIATHEALAYLRIQPGFPAFKESDFQVLPEFSDQEEDEPVQEPAAALPAADNGPDLLEEIRRLQSLKELGVLTEEEFLEQKSRLERN